MLSGKEHLSFFLPGGYSAEFEFVLADMPDQLTLRPWNPSIEDSKVKSHWNVYTICSLVRVDAAAARSLPPCHVHGMMHASVHCHANSTFGAFTALGFHARALSSLKGTFHFHLMELSILAVTCVCIRHLFWSATTSSSPIFVHAGATA